MPACYYFSKRHNKLCGEAIVLGYSFASFGHIPPIGRDDLHESRVRVQIQRAEQLLGTIKLKMYDTLQYTSN